MRGESECCHWLAASHKYFEDRKVVSIPAVNVNGLWTSQISERKTLGLTALTIQCLSIAKYNVNEKKVRIMFVLNQKMFYSLAVKEGDFSKEKIS